MIINLLFLGAGVIPSNIDILVVIYTLHRRKDIWGENADEFNPDNFLPENEEKRSRYSYIPFSFGPRNCIGAKYAMTNIRIILARLLMHYKFSTSLKLKDLELDYASTILVKNGNLVRIDERCDTSSLFFIFE